LAPFLWLPDRATERSYSLMASRKYRVIEKRTTIVANKINSRGTTYRPYGGFQLAQGKKKQKTRCATTKHRVRKQYQEITL